MRIEDFGLGIISRDLDGLGELGPYLLHVILAERSEVERCDRLEAQEAGRAAEHMVVHAVLGLLPVHDDDAVIIVGCDKLRRGSAGAEVAQ